MYIVGRENHSRGNSQCKGWDGVQFGGIQQGGQQRWNLDVQHPIHIRPREKVSTRTNLATEGTIFRSLRVDLLRAMQQTHHLHLQGEQYCGQHLSLKHSTPLKQESRVTGLLPPDNSHLRPTDPKLSLGRWGGEKVRYCPGTSASPTEMKAFDQTSDPSSS